MKWFGLFVSFLTISSCSNLNSKRSPSSVNVGEWINVAEGELIFTRKGVGGSEFYLSYSALDGNLIHFSDNYISSDTRLVFSGEVEKLNCSRSSNSEGQVYLTRGSHCRLKLDASDARVNVKLQRALDQSDSEGVYRNLKYAIESSELDEKYSSYSSVKDYSDKKYSSSILEYESYSGYKDVYKTLAKLYGLESQEIAFDKNQKSVQLKIPTNEEVYVKFSGFEYQAMQKNILGIKKKKFKDFEDSDVGKFGVVCRSSNKEIFKSGWVNTKIETLNLQEPINCKFNLPRKMSKRLIANAKMKVSFLTRNNIQKAVKLSEDAFNAKVAEAREKQFLAANEEAKKNFEKLIADHNSKVLKNIALDKKFDETFKSSIQLAGAQYFVVYFLPQINTVKMSEKKYRHYLDLKLVVDFTIEDSEKKKIHEEQVGEYFTIRSKDNIGETDKELTPEQIKEMQRSVSLWIKTDTKGMNRILDVISEQKADPRLLVAVDELVQEIENKNAGEPIKQEAPRTGQGICTSEIQLESGEYQIVKSHAYARYTVFGEETRFQGDFYKDDDMGMVYVPVIKQEKIGSPTASPQYVPNTFKCESINKSSLMEKYF